MKIVISINYHTVWGESLFISGSLPELGMGNADKALEMKLVSPDTWCVVLEGNKGFPEFYYSFIVKAPEKEWRFEWGTPHKFIPFSGVNDYEIISTWQSLPPEKPFYSSAFIDGMLKRTFRDQPLPGKANTIRFSVEAPMVEPGEVLALVGEGSALGNWNGEHALIMNDSRFPIWEVAVNADSLSLPLEYKFIILNKDTKIIKAWEPGSNRVLNRYPTTKDSILEFSDIRFDNPKENWRGAGTAIPVFSLRSENDFGVGDFMDIKRMVDWCEITGQKILQLLPINDTTLTGTWLDSYPYKANSIFALHPLYLNPWKVGTLKDKSRQEHFYKKAKKLNELEQVDYEAVLDSKNEYLRELYVERGASVRRRNDYKKFVTINEYWLKPYAAWCLLREKYGTPDNSLWEEYAEYDNAKIDNLCKQNPDKILYYYFVQYHLDMQLHEARDYAHSKGVVLKGDIPIGISRNSVDAWQRPKLFNMNTQAGAPPDEFSVLGQNWGLPTYNWDEMAKDGFLWWKNRFRKMAEYFDAYRIDHILGFFRIWEIPMDAVHGLLGYFNPALPYTSDELRNNYDFWINPDVQTKPLILEWMLYDLFGEYTQDAKDNYLTRLSEDRYCLNEFVNTQRKVEDYFEGKDDDASKRIKDGLLGLIDDVLFVEDPYNRGQYHPRIAGQQTYQYRVLSDYAKWNFNRLYDDFFYHRHNDFWYGKAMWKLPPLLDSTSMLTCAEDLGMIPACVPDVMSKLQILSLEIQRMPKNPKSEFGNTAEYPYFSVCTTSTHDMAGIRGWWEEDKGVSQRFFNQILGESGEAPLYCEPWICDKIIELNLKSPSILCILPLQDWFACDGDIRRTDPREEQINVPANPNHYWRYRMHITIEDLVRKDSFNAYIKRIIEDSGR